MKRVIAEMSLGLILASLVLMAAVVSGYSAPFIYQGV